MEPQVSGRRPENVWAAVVEDSEPKLKSEPFFWVQLMWVVLLLCLLVVTKEFVYGPRNGNKNENKNGIKTYKKDKNMMIKGVYQMWTR